MRIRRGLRGAMLSGRPISAAARPLRERGQSLVELTLILPLLLLIILAAIDFGRVFLGWIAVNQMARVGANYAAMHPNDWPPPAPDENPPAYEVLLQSSADDLNCELRDLDAPEFQTPKDPGAQVRARVDCDFTVLTPIIANIVGGTIRVGGDAAFPIGYGCLADCPPPPPEATPPPPPDNCRTLPALTGKSVGGARAAWVAAGFLAENFDVDAGVTDTRTVSSYSFTEDPGAEVCSETTDRFFTLQVDIDVEPLGTPTSATCRFVPNVIGMTVADARTAWTDPTTGFTGAFTPATGSDSQIVISQTTDPPSAPGECLEPETTVQVAYEEPPDPPPPPPCNVPSFVNTHTSAASGTWTAKGFVAGNLSFKQQLGQSGWTIRSQTLVGGTWVSCNARIELSRNP